MDSILLGLAHSRYYCVEPSAFAVFRSQLMAFLGSRDAVRMDRTPATGVMATVKDGKLMQSAADLMHFHTYDDTDDDDFDDDYEDNLESEQPFVHIIRLTGPMTRGGGACSYGSIEMRDRLIQMADIKGVIGHIIYCRTPGGDANTLLDFRKAIDYIHSKDQKIYMFCDGTVASGGAFLSAMCDGVYAYNGEDQIGSLGMYAAFFTLAHGAQNAITQETYCECYADRSTDKNLWYRKAAEGDTKLLEEDLRNHLGELLTNLHNDRPSITEDQMSGKMYRMKDVVGTLIDGICTLPELVEKVAADYHNSTQNMADDEENQTKSLTDMKEYKELARMAGYEPEQTISADKEGMVSLQAQEADAIESAISAKIQLVNSLTEENARMKEQLEAQNATADALKAEVERLTQELEEAKAGLESTVEQAKQDQEALTASADAVKAEMDKVLADLKEAKDALEAQMKADAEKAAAEMAKMAQTIADLNVKLEEAESGENTKVVAGASPATNGASPAVQMGDMPGWNPSLTPSENAQAMQDYLDGLRRR